jgi:hypothetical protein
MNHVVKLEKACGGENPVGRALHKEKHGTLHSGSKKGPKVGSRKQAVAIGLSEARAKGMKVPKKKGKKIRKALVNGELTLVVKPGRLLKTINKLRKVS